MRTAFLTIVLIIGFAAASPGQLLFTAGTDTNQALFERVNGQTVQINTGLSTHNLPGLSRDGRFVTFGTPDPPQGNGINPSADLYLFDRVTRLTRRMADHFSNFDGAFQMWNDVLSSQASPGGQFIAYGVAIFRGLGGTGGQATNELNILDTGTGIIVSNPTSQRGPSSDAFAAEFRGVSFAPDGLSFVTPLYRFIGISDPLPIELPTIVRFTRDAASGQWILGPNLSAPKWSRNPQTLVASASIHTYPALSPSGNGLAYFSVLVPDASASTSEWISRVVIADAEDGGNVRVLPSFDPGLVPSGLTWTSDGTALVASVSQQFKLGISILPAPRRSISKIYSISTANGSRIQITELGTNAVAPMLPLTQAPTVDLANLPLSLSSGAQGTVVLRAPDVPDAAILTLQTSDGGLGDFRSVQQINGAQLRSGFAIPTGLGARFFRLTN